MVTTLTLTNDVSEQLSVIVERLISIAPRGSKCIFLNLEMRDSEVDNAVSADLFAVTKSLFGNVKRATIDADWETAALLRSLAKLVATQSGIANIIIDIIINEKRQYEAYRDDGPLRRLDGGDRMYRAKYRYYVDSQPWLAALDKTDK